MKLPKIPNGIQTMLVGVVLALIAYLTNNAVWDLRQVFLIILAAIGSYLSTLYTVRTQIPDAQFQANKLASVQQDVRVLASRIGEQSTSGEVGSIVSIEGVSFKELRDTLETIKVEIFNTRIEVSNIRSLLVLPEITRSQAEVRPPLAAKFEPVAKQPVQEVEHWKEVMPKEADPKKVLSAEEGTSY